MTVMAVALLNVAMGVLTIYTVMCFVRIILTWFPGALWTKFGRFLCAMCDPFMNLFAKLPLRFGMLDFSPVVAIGVLTLGSSLLDGVARTGRIYLAGVLMAVLNLLWSVVQSLLSLLTLVLIVRFIVSIIQKGEAPYNSIWYALDRALSPIIGRISKLLTGGKKVTYQKALALSIVTLILISVAGMFIVYLLCQVLAMIPF